jgi:DNA-dependent RNA polymerase auxiliary subunit epsilon
MAFSFRKLIKIGNSSDSKSSVVDTKQNVNISENVLKARNAHTSLSLVMYICLILGIGKPLFLMVASVIILYMFFNKHAKLRMHVSTASYNLQLLKLDKARKHLEKARKVLDIELINELEKNILDAEKIHKRR